MPEGSELRRAAVERFEAVRREFLRVADAILGAK